MNPSEATLFFVGGQGKSGTTWIQLMLDAHPKISCRGEGHLCDQFLPMLEQAYQHYGEFLQQNNKIFSELAPYKPPSPDELATVARLAIIERMRRQCPAEGVALGERTPSNIDGIQHLTHLFPHAKFVHCLRDPRDIAVSLWFHGQRTGGPAFLNRYPTLLVLSQELALAWSRGIRKARTEDLDKRYIEVKFEQAIRDPHRVMDQLCTFLHINGSQQDIDNCVKQSAFSTLSGRNPGTENSDSHFRKGIIGDWKNHLGEAELTVFAEQSGDLMEELGYV